MKKGQTGFTLLAMVFILVVLALAGTYLLKLSFGQVQLVNYTLLTTRAKLATLSAFELLNSDNENRKLTCEDHTFDFGLESKALSGFNVKVSCTQSLSYPLDTAPTFIALQLKAKATRGNFGERDYVSYEQSRWFVHRQVKP